MILLRSTYSGTPEEVAKLRPAHLEWIDEQIAAGAVIAAGRLTDGSGAAILGAGENADALLALFDEDPYVTGGVASYAHIITFPAALGSDAIKALDGAA